MGAVLTQLTEQGEGASNPLPELHYYLDGNSFLVMTDHNPLVWLNRNVSSNPRLMRWALALQPYNFRIVHRSGKSHKNADSLSRSVFVKSGPGFLDNEWFKGAAFNYAENILKIRDDREAILYLDEEGNFEKVTFAEMFQEVKLYAAAFRKHGLQKGDMVACYMSNRKEAIYAMLAVTSIGAIWGGPQPFLGAKAASNIVARLEAKFLIAVDSFMDYGEEHRIMDNLPFIADNASTLEKIIIVPTKKETLPKDISHIPNSVFLEPFLESGKTTNDKIPDIVFEQLPFDHPVYVAFTSGTSSLPKGIVHQAGAWVRMPETTWMSVNVYCLRGLEVLPLVRLVEEEEIWETTDHSQGILPQNWRETELNRSFTCIVLKATLTAGVT
ncbi:acetoacetyl-CoA synthetase [Trichonephila clavipes]|nr:acetoacetyl-CoA synthetase [Trichonephila clavipes]